MSMKFRRATRRAHLRSRPARTLVRHVVTTMMFTDIVGSTRLLAATGDDAWVELLLWHDLMLRGLFRIHGGREVKQVGDGFFVVFDDPSAALACAMAILSLLAKPGSGRPAVSVRLGIHRSDVIQVGNDYAGRGVHEAARIAALAGEGEILVSAGTVTGVAPALITEPPRTVTLRGLAEGVEVLSIVGPAAAGAPA